MVFIRPMSSGDFSAICDLIRVELGYECTNPRLNAILQHPEYKTFVAVHGNEVVGFVGFQVGLAFNMDGESIQIIALAVRGTHQGQGIGTELLGQVEAYARENGIEVIGLNSGFHREMARRFYEGRGYLPKGYSFIKYLG